MLRSKFNAPVLFLLLSTLQSFGATPRAKVFVFMSMKCPCSQSHETKLRALAERFRSSEIEFVGIHSNSDEDPALAQVHFKDANLGFSVLEDTDGKWIHKLGATKTPHAFVVLSNGKLAYSGGVDDSAVASEARENYLEVVLNAIVAGNPVPYEKKRALGCQILRRSLKNSGAMGEKSNG